MSILTAPFGGRHVPKQVLLDALEIADEMRIIVISYMDSDGTPQTEWSNGNYLKRIAMMEVSKMEMTEAAGSG